MRELLRDVKTMTAIVRRRLLRNIVPALGKLDRVSRGRDSFHNEQQFRACITLARLAPIFIAHAIKEDDEHDVTGTIFDPAWMTPEKELGLRRLEWLHSLTPEESAQIRGRL
jgi:hypothetical protein